MNLLSPISKLFVLALLVSTTALVTACGTNGSNKKDKVKTASVPVPNPKVCLGGSTLQPNSSSYSLYQNSGFQPATFQPAAWNSWNTAGVGAYAYAYVGVYPGYGYAAQYGYPYSNPWPYGTPYGYSGGYQTGYPTGYPSGSYGQPINTGGATAASCTCPSGMIPACDTTGMTCVSQYEVMGLGQNVAMYNYNGSAFVFDNYYGSSNWYQGSSSSCRIAQSCVVGTPSCGYGTCRPLRSGSTVGICTN